MKRLLLALALAGLGVGVYVTQHRVERDSTPTNAVLAAAVLSQTNPNASTPAVHAAVGKPAPELANVQRWVNTAGQSLRIADLRGKVVLLEFWAVW